MFSYSLSGSDVITDRLALRLWSNAEVIAAVDGGRIDCWAADFPAEGDRVIAGIIQQQSGETAEYGHRLIVERDSNLVVGSISLFWPPSDGAVEFGYGVVPSRRRRGYASEATRALVEFALGAAEVRTVFADIELSNPASARVLEKAGLLLWHEDAETARYFAGADQGLSV